jgi:predicted phosphodiesterase
MLRRYREDLHERLYDVAVVGHTHKAGRFSDWYFNSGSWTAHKNNFLCISPGGDVELFDWRSSGPLLNSESVI